MFKIKQIIVKKDGYAMVACDTRFPWLHKNFGGWEGWRKALNDALHRDGYQGYHILGRFFGHLIFLDVDTTELWLKPRYEAGTSAARFGWLYWALCWTKGTWYPNPARAQVDWYEKTAESKMRAWGASVE